MASAIIYLAIIGMWVAYFLPRWIHTHDEFSGKSVERYKSALRVVAGENSQPYSMAIHTDLDADYRVAQALLRRRILFIFIALTLLATMVGVIMNIVNWAYIAIPISAFIVYVAHTRRSINRERIRRRRMANIQKSTDGISHFNLTEVLNHSTENWVPFSEREETGIVLLPQGSTTARNVWQPSPVPVPTYVSAPKAVTPRRVIEVNVPSTWTPEQEKSEREMLAAAGPSSDEVFDQQISDEVRKQNRAANL